MSARGSRGRIAAADARGELLVTISTKEAGVPPAAPGMFADTSWASRAVWQRPALLVAGLALAHILVWTVVPALVHRGLPIDVLEGYTVGRHWLLGDHKHPSFPWWLVEVSRIVTGQVGWPAYLLSALCIASTYGLVFAIGRRLLDAERAAAGTLLLTGVLYFSWVTPEFNHNVLQMPFWVALILCLLAARSSGSTLAWVGVGAIGAIGLYAKLSTAILLATAAIFILVDRDCRRQIATLGPWLGLATFALLASPLVHWLLRTDFAAFDYASTRASSTAGSASLFLLKQVASSLGFYTLLLVACVRHGWRQRIDWPRWPRKDWSALEIIAFFHFVPLALAIVAALVSNNGLKGSWATPMLSLSGLLVAALAPRLIDARALRRIAIGAGIFLVIVPAAYATSVLQWDRFATRPPRVVWPQREIAEHLERIWQERTGHPLRYVVGDAWYAGMIATYGSSRPVPIVDGDLNYAPSVSLADIERDGALIVYGPGPAYPPHHLRWLAGDRVDGREVIPMRSHEREVRGTFWYTMIAPGSVIAEPTTADHLADRYHAPGRKRERPSQ